MVVLGIVTGALAMTVVFAYIFLVFVSKAISKNLYVRLLLSQVVMTGLALLIAPNKTAAFWGCLIGWIVYFAVFIVIKANSNESMLG